MAPRSHDFVADSFVAKPSEPVVKYLELAALALSAVFIVWIRFQRIEFYAHDLTAYFLPWFDRLQTQGFSALSRRFADYNAPYLYLLWLGGKLGLSGIATVKLIASLGDLWLAIAVYRVVVLYCTRRTAVISAFVLLLLPSVWLDSSAWPQTDTLLAAPLIWAVGDYLRGRSYRAWLWFAVAVAFKAQAIFLLPFMGLLFAMSSPRRWLAPFVIPPVYLLAGVPAMLAGLPLRTYLGTYKAQTGTEFRLTMTDNFWGFVVIGAEHHVEPLALPFAVASVALFMAVALARARWQRDPAQIMAAGAAVTLMVYYLLPAMRNRYIITAEILVFIYAFARPSRWWLAVVLTFTSTLAMIHYLFNSARPFNDSFWGIPVLVVLAVLCRDALMPRPRTPEPDDPTADQPESESDKPDRPESDEGVTDRPESDQAVSDRPESDQAVSDRPESDEADPDRPESDGMGSNPSSASGVAEASKPTISKRMRRPADNVAPRVGPADPT